MTKITGISYSLSSPPTSLAQWQNKLTEEIRTLIQSGSEIIVYPELFLMGLVHYFETNDQTEQFEKISDYILNTLLLHLEKEFKKDNILLVLGSGPIKSNGKYHNAAPIFVNGQWIFQSKIYLTPWEDCFIAGEELNIFEFKNMKAAVVICFDIEQPYLAQKLKETGIDLILSPSATTNKNGNQRVNRCASSRAVELGAAVLAVPVVGTSDCDLVDYNEGRQGFFLPAQDDVTIEQEQFSAYSTQEHIVQSYDFDHQIILNLKMKSFETRPFLKEDPKKLLIRI